MQKFIEQLEFDRNSMFDNCGDLKEKYRLKFLELENEEINKMYRKGVRDGVKLAEPF